MVYHNDLATDDVNSSKTASPSLVPENTKLDKPASIDNIDDVERCDISDYHLPIAEPKPNFNGNDTTPSHSAHPRCKQRTITTYLFDPISSRSHLTTMLLLTLALATGINDAATFMDYHIFVSNQTGNTVFLGIGALSRAGNFDLRHVGLSLGGFCLGGLFSGQVSRLISSKRARWWVVTSNAIQTIMMLTAAALRYWYDTVDSPDSTHGAPIVALLALSSGLQVAMARGLGVVEIPTGMITSTWIELVCDEKVWVVWKRRPSRDKRLEFVLCILAGGFVGAAAHVYSNAALPLLLAGILKVVVTIGFALGQRQETSDSEEEQD